MSLVAYGSSDESENEEETNEEEPKVETKIEVIPVQNVNRSTKLHLPTPKVEQTNNINGESTEKDSNEQKLNFDVIPKPKQITVEEEDIDIKEADNVPVPKKVNYTNIEKPPKKEKGPTKISIPSLSEFKDLEEESEDNHSKKQPSEKGSGLIGMLPPPKSSIITTKTNSMVPYVLTKKPIETNPIETKTAVSQVVKKIKNPASQIKSALTKSYSTFKSLSHYNSDSEDDDEKGSSSGMDFFSLSTPTKIPDEFVSPMSSIDTNAFSVSSTLSKPMDVEESPVKNEGESNKTLVSNVMNLPKEEILFKNKAEVGPKLPVPEQEYNIDAEGNVAFDDKAIEYLCGRRGVKRRSEFSNVDIVEINGEDIKPDEREWLIKALTEEPVQRSMSAGAGPSGLSKKKHQITYLAHQAKAMELELKNQWAQNKASRQQTRSKYGF